MKKNTHSITISLLFFVGLIGNLCASSKPNVLLIILDDLNDFVGHMGGHPQVITPNIDALATQGVAFNNAHSNAAVCIPSRASFMSGVSPITSRFYGFGNERKNETLSASKTLPELARENGYKTYTTGKVFHSARRDLWDDNGIAAEYGPVASDGKNHTYHPEVPGDFSEFGVLDGTYISLAKVPIVTPSAFTSGYTGWRNIRSKAPFHYVSETDRDPMADERSAEWTVQKIRSLESQDQDDPFFMAVGFIRPHTPLVVPQKYFDMYPLESVQLPIIDKSDRADTRLEDDNNSRGRKIYHTLVDSYGGDRELALRHYTQAYLASITFADEMVGQVMKALDQSKFRDNTVVILTSDHGYHIGEKDFLFKYTIWEESTRVPFIIRHPGYQRQAGSIVEHPISLIDLFPTISDFCDWENLAPRKKSSGTIDGFSLKPFLEDPDLISWDGPNSALSIRASWMSQAIDRQHFSLRSRDFRYIKYNKPAGEASEELYDHRDDPHEWNNLAESPKYESVIQAMRRELAERLTPAVKRQSAKL